MFAFKKIPRQKSQDLHDETDATSNRNKQKLFVTMFESKRAQIIVYLSSRRLCSCFILLGCDTHLAIFGKARFTHLCGPMITIWGGNIGPNPSSSYDLYSPTSHTPLSITQCPHEKSEYVNKNAAQGLQSSEIKVALESLCDPSDVQVLTERLGKEMSVFRDHVTVLHFSPHRSRVLNSLSEIKRFRFLFHLPSEGTVPNASLAKLLGFTFLEHDGSLGYQVAPEVSRISLRLRSVPVVDPCNDYVRKLLICGPKGAGKSSLLRFLSNIILTDVEYPLKEKCVAVLDCDIGQPEFTPNGIISLCLVKLPLFGPPYTHILSTNVNIIRQCFVGCITPSDDPSFYLKCLNFVYDAYVNLPEPKPRLLVNTMGWMQGLGLTLLLEQILLVKPDLIIQLRTTGSSNNRTNSPDLNSSSLKTMDTWNSRDISNETFNHDVILIESDVKLYKYNTIDDPRYNLGPPDHRDLMMLTYFMSTLACAYTSLPSRLKDEPLGHPVAHLLDCIPYQVPVTVPSKQQDKCGNVNEQKNVILSSSVSTFDVQHDTLEIDSLYTNKNDSNHLAFRIMRPDSNLFAENFAFPSSVDSLLACLNATLVALCVVPQHNITEPDSTCMYRWISSNPVCECVGLAICRAVDPTAGVIYLTTGVSEDDLLKVTGILRGNVNLPNCFFLDQPFFRTQVYEETSSFLPYLGPVSTQGKGRAGLPSRRSYPKTMHHATHRMGTSDVMD
ncbi:polynucleotide 5'-hydroxyl-kinase GRC3/NOL9 [Schistosoma bovis]|uniref:Polynucleotide 5'-hydroxyl-kinase GRC3/NOL9 n=1 Tax=Schistosoma bovis TaxID=6184 RepID=A0A430QRQ0_SCHBO|nr:polynucleotide 5'-hydroxyl-kinase GRC3/NOL9 [Schistosoma bovis]